MHKIVPLRLKTAAKQPKLTTRYIQTSLSKGAEGWLFIDSVFPIQVARWDLRHYIGKFRQEYLVAQIISRLEHSLDNQADILSVEPYPKDGGVFIRIRLNSQEVDRAWENVCHSITDEGSSSGYFASWHGVNRGKAWVVRGAPWREDMNRFASPTLRVSIEGDVGEEEVYHLFRPYGQISDLVVAHPSSGARLCTVTFKRLRSAVIARNVLHNYNHQGFNAYIHASYSPTIGTNLVTAWLSSHPKVLLPLLVFVAGALTYAVFDPIRAIMVQARVLDWFNYQSISNRITASLGFAVSPTPMSDAPTDFPLTGEVWMERRDAIRTLKSYFQGIPETIVFLYGPSGSGKANLVDSVVREADRKVLVIDCRQLQKATSDSQILQILAEQTGYMPVFSFLMSLGNVMDMIAMGLIGQKAGFSTSISDQVQRILQTVSIGLKRVGSHNQSAVEHHRQIEAQVIEQGMSQNYKRWCIHQGIWHDGRLDCVAGNGIMSELGIGDEPVSDKDVSNGDIPFVPRTDQRDVFAEKGVTGSTRVATLPVVIIENYQPKAGAGIESILDVFAQWAISLASNNIAHVVFVSDKKENIKRVAKALSGKSAIAIALGDADERVTLNVIRRRLQDMNITFEPTPEQISAIERLGGRASEIDSIVYQLRSGQDVETVVDELIVRSANELRVLAFGDDIGNMNDLPWSQEQAWTVIKGLARQSEMGYYDTILGFPFKGDEAALQSMERAELVNIVMQEGRPIIIRPGRPVYKWAFLRLVNDAAFQAAQDILYNDKLIAHCQKTITSCEHELAMLRTIKGVESRWWWESSPTSQRANHLLKKMMVEERKVEIAQRKNSELRRKLAVVYP